MNHIFIVLVEFYPTWLAMSRDERGKRANELKEITLKYPEVHVRFFDAEALPGKDYTDIIMCETKNIQKYHYMWEEIRDHSINTAGHMKIKDVIMGMEEAYKNFEKDSLKNT
ncbi:Darcynin 2 [Bacillus paramycoides]|uniref:darcynin family protein n=1 Tax=Bacillus paramycoides TaxID=2026194 RepID=UPI0015BC899F|nr:darcynin family protein [Bacillus paramycoides]NWK69518.1 Darcynin 2 [Bacillus paramycoides]